MAKDSEEYAIWHLEQTINFGLNGEKLSETELRKYWTRLSLDPHRLAFLELLLHGHMDEVKN